MRKPLALDRIVIYGSADYCGLCENPRDGDELTEVAHSSDLSVMCCEFHAGFLAGIFSFLNWNEKDQALEAESDSHNEREGRLGKLATLSLELNAVARTALAELTYSESDDPEIEKLIAALSGIATCETMAELIKAGKA